MKAVPRSRYLTFVAIAVIGCLIDLMTKEWIFAQMGMPFEQPSRWLVSDIFGFTISLNEGALFGIGQGQVPLFAGLSIVAAIGILYWLFVAGAAQDWLLTIALGAVTAGIFGNLYDRVGLPGLKWNFASPSHAVGDPVYAVRDWLHFKVEGVIDWPIFNIADSLLVCGAALLVWHAIRAEGPRASSETLEKPAGV